MSTQDTKRATQKAITQARNKLLRQEAAVTDTKQLILALEEMLQRLK